VPAERSPFADDDASAEDEIDVDTVGKVDLTLALALVVAAAAKPPRTKRNLLPVLVRGATCDMPTEVCDGGDAEAAADILAAADIFADFSAADATPAAVALRLPPTAGDAEDEDDDADDASDEADEDARSLEWLAPPPADDGDNGLR
jgi:hypothetical protein